MAGQATVSMSAVTHNLSRVHSMYDTPQSARVSDRFQFCQTTLIILSRMSPGRFGPLTHPGCLITGFFGNAKATLRRSVSNRV
jgi:hypothetical protein